MAYSRLQSIEEKKNIRRAYLTIFFSVVAVILLFFYGFPLVGKFSAFISEFGKSNKGVTVNDRTPPAPPRFNSFSNFTNQQNFQVTGSSEPGSTVKLTLNGTEQDNLADKDGNFTFNLNLMSGDNTFTAVAVDSAGNVSQKTQDYKVSFDSKAPALNLDSPSSGSQFYGSNQRQVTIKGSTDPNCQVTVNDRIVAVDDAGAFQYTTTLNQGDNKFTFKSVDQAGNSTSKDITLTFNP